jgi:NAD(P)-dependent dehydrogenase (short-subunit alcohol dehydrogenase family)
LIVAAFIDWGRVAALEWRAMTQAHSAAAGQLAGKVGIITGAARGIGAGIAELFAREGASLVLADLNAEEGRAVATRLKNEGAFGEIVFRRCDVSHAAQVHGLVDSAVRELGRLDFVINNAGYAVYKGVEETTEEEWDGVVGVCFSALFYATKYAAPHLRKTRGAVVNVASVRALATTADVFAYSAAKAGVLGLTRAAAHVRRRRYAAPPGKRRRHRRPRNRLASDPRAHPPQAPRPAIGHRPGRPLPVHRSVLVGDRRAVHHRRRHLVADRGVTALPFAHRGRGGRRTRPPALGRRRPLWGRRGWRDRRALPLRGAGRPAPRLQRQPRPEVAPAGLDSGHAPWPEGSARLRVPA